MKDLTDWYTVHPDLLTNGREEGAGLLHLLRRAPVGSWIDDVQKDKRSSKVFGELGAILHSLTSTVRKIDRHDDRAPLVEIMFRGRMRLTNGQYRARRHRHHALGRTAEENPLDTLPPVSPHDDDVRPVCGCRLTNRHVGYARSLLAGDHRRAVVQVFHGLLKATCGFAIMLSAQRIDTIMDI